MVIDEKGAIKILSQRDDFGIPCGMTSGYPEAIDTAIKALKDVKRYKYVIDNIKAEISSERDSCDNCTEGVAFAYGLELVLEIIDKYIKEVES